MTTYDSQFLLQPGHESRTILHNCSDNGIRHDRRMDDNSLMNSDQNAPLSQDQMSELREAVERIQKQSDERTADNASHICTIIDVLQERLKSQAEADLERDQWTHERSVAQFDREAILERELADLRRLMARQSEKDELVYVQTVRLMKEERHNMLLAVLAEYYEWNSGISAASSCCWQTCGSAISKGLDTPCLKKSIEEVRVALINNKCPMHRQAYEYDSRFRDKIADLQRAAYRSENLQAVNALISKCKQDLQILFIVKSQSLRDSRRRIACAVRTFYNELRNTPGLLLDTAGYTKVFEALRVPWEIAPEGSFVFP